MRYRKWIISSLLVLLVAVVAGCQSIGYYKQAISGQMQMVSNQQPLSRLIADDKTKPELREKFRLVLALREYAEKELNLVAGDRYLSYVDLQRSNAVWNVYAAPELSLQPKAWWYPVVGRVTYRGYFSEAAAETYAKEIRKLGYDVYVGGVDAYSTLGWFKDPVLNTFIGDSERRLAALIFHELTHERLFISGDTEFNEALATAVAEEGLRRWLLEKNDPVALEKYQAELKRKKQFVSLVRTTRDALKVVFQDSTLSDAEKRQRKEQTFQVMQENYARLKAQWGGHTSYDVWFSENVNNAKLNTVSAYYDLVPVFHQLIEDQNGDLKQFFTEMKRYGKLTKEKRHERLAAVKITEKPQMFAAPDSPKPNANPPL